MFLLFLASCLPTSLADMSEASLLLALPGDVLNISLEYDFEADGCVELDPAPSVTVAGIDAGVESLGELLTGTLLYPGSRCRMPTWTFPDAAAVLPAGDVEIRIADRSSNLQVTATDVATPLTFTVVEPGDGVLRSGEALVLSLFPTTYTWSELLEVRLVDAVGELVDILEVEELRDDQVTARLPDTLAAATARVRVYGTATQALAGCEGAAMCETERWVEAELDVVIE